VSESASGRSLRLLVEGRTDVDVFAALLARSGREDVHLIEYGGKTRLAARLRALALDDDFKRTCRWLGVVRDADDDEAATVQSIHGALVQAGLPSPSTDARATSGRPMVQIMVLPGDGGAGELEDVIWRAIASANPDLAICVSEYLNCMRPNGIGAPDLAKARVYAFVAALTRPDRPLGATARASDSPLPLESPILQELLDSIPSADLVPVLNKL